MGFWFFMLLSVLLIPGMLLLFGWMFRAHAPQTMNYVFGYRTRRSMRNADTWQFAQAEFARLSWRWGLVELPVGILAMLPLLGKNTGLVGVAGSILCGVFCIPIFVIIWQVEHALKASFDENGKRKMI